MELIYVFRISLGAIKSKQSEISLFYKLHYLKSNYFAILLFVMNVIEMFGQKSAGMSIMKSMKTF